MVVMTSSAMTATALATVLSFISVAGSDRLLESIPSVAI
jgi:hypothetical protein